MKHEETLLAVLASHGDGLQRIAHVYAGGDGEDEDLYQEILMEAWKALPSFRGDSSFSTWLYRVALNTALTWRRRSAQRQNHRVAMTARMEAVGFSAAVLALAAVARRKNRRDLQGVVRPLIEELESWTVDLEEMDPEPSQEEPRRIADCATSDAAKGIA